MSHPSIGFIGLGLMGSAMVEHLQNSGYGLTVMANRSRAHVDAAVSRGASEVKTAREVAAASDIVMLCMDTSASVESRMYGEDGVIAGLASDAVVIDFGTSLPNSTISLGAAVEQAGGKMLDAPLGRTPAHAKDGLLNIMAAGDKAAFEKVKPVLEVLGENVFHLGALGAGHTIKLINNFFGMTTAAAMSEAFAVAEKAGIEKKQLHEVMAAGPLHSMMMDFVAAFAVDGDKEKLAFSIRNASKDVGYYSRMADDLGAASMMSTATKQAFNVANSAGYGDNMVSEMHSFFQGLYDDKDKI
ncbi:MAG: NAD(P)-dependent oxidoreductase [Granulosicoccus sp.]|nr:NAD(P)-dependent oxidoreductase [Granulosicoccus sp.]